MPHRKYSVTIRDLKSVQISYYETNGTGMISFAGQRSVKRIDFRNDPDASEKTRRYIKTFFEKELYGENSAGGIRYYPEELTFASINPSTFRLNLKIGEARYAVKSLLEMIEAMTLHLINSTIEGSSE